MYSIFYKKEFNNEECKKDITEQELIDNNYNIDISEVGNIKDFRLSDSVVFSKKSIKVSMELKIWFYYFLDYKKLIENSGGKRYDLTYIQTGTKVIVKKNDNVGHYMNHNDIDILFGKCIEFYYNPDKGNCVLSFNTPSDGSLYSEM